MNYCPPLLCLSACLSILLGGSANLHGASATYRLSKPEPGAASRIEISMQVGGDMKLAPAGTKEERTLPMSVVAKLNYTERVVSTGEPGLAYRQYETATAAIKVDKGGETPTLSEKHRLVGIETVSGTPTLFSPHGHLTREELDLIDVPGSSLVIHDLLPKEPVAIGATWKHNDQVLATLLGLEGVSFSDVQSVLSEVTDGVATVMLGGSVGGAVAGVGTEMEVKAKYTYDLGQKRITWFALLIKEKRAVGHVGPGLDVVAKVIIRMAPVATPAALSQDRLDRLPQAATGDVAALTFSAPTRGLRFNYDRRWYVTSDENELVVMRLIDRGELVAQCNVAPLKTAATKAQSLSEFQQEVQKALGKNFSQFVHAANYTDEHGASVYRVVARGEVSGLAIRWIYYMVSGKNGRVSLAFTLEDDLTDRFGRADRELVANVDLTAPVKNPAATTVLLPGKPQAR